MSDAIRTYQIGFKDGELCVYAMDCPPFHKTRHTSPNSAISQYVRGLKGDIEELEREVAHLQMRIAQAEALRQ